MAPYIPKFGTRMSLADKAAKNVDSQIMNINTRTTTSAKTRTKTSNRIKTIQEAESHDSEKRRTKNDEFPRNFSIYVDNTRTRSRRRRRSTVATHHKRSNVLYDDCDSELSEMQMKLRTDFLNQFAETNNLNEYLDSNSSDDYSYEKQNEMKHRNSFNNVQVNRVEVWDNTNRRLRNSKVKTLVRNPNETMEQVKDYYVEQQLGEMEMRAAGYRWRYKYIPETKPPIREEQREEEKLDDDEKQIMKELRNAKRERLEYNRKLGRILDGIRIRAKNQRIYDEYLRKKNPEPEKRNTWNDFKEKMSNVGEKVKQILNRQPRPQAETEPRNNDRDVMPYIDRIAFEHINESALDSLTSETRDVDETTVFKMIYDKVYDYNEARGRNEIGIIHPDYLEHCIEFLKLKLNKHPHPFDYNAFFSLTNERLIIPIIRDDRYVLVEVKNPEWDNKLNGSNTHYTTQITVYDPTFKKRFSEDQIKRLVKDCRWWKNLEVTYATKKDIQEQKTPNSGGIHMIQNAEALLKRSAQKSSSTRLKNWYLEDEKKENLEQRRERFYGELVKSLYSVEGEKRRTQQKTKPAETNEVESPEKTTENVSENHDEESRETDVELTNQKKKVENCSEDDVVEYLEPKSTEEEIQHNINEEPEPEKDVRQEHESEFRLQPAPEKENRKATEKTKLKKKLTKLVNGLRGVLLGGSGTQETTQERNQNRIPNAANERYWYLIDEIDIKSVEDPNQDMTDAALSRLLMEKVEASNNKTGSDRIGLMHHSFFLDWKESLSSGRTLSPEDYYCFPSEDNQRLLIPILDNRHFVLAEIRMEHGNEAIRVHDSMFERSPVNLTHSALQNLAVMATGNQTFLNINPEHSSRDQIREQTDSTSCGVHVIQNAEAIIQSEMNSNRTTNLHQFYTSSPNCSIIDERHRLASDLVRLRMDMNGELDVNQISSFDKSRQRDSSDLATNNYPNFDNQASFLNNLKQRDQICFAADNFPNLDSQQSFLENLKQQDIINRAANNFPNFDSQQSFLENLRKQNLNGLAAGSFPNMDSQQSFLDNLRQRDRNDFHSINDYPNLDSQQSFLEKLKRRKRNDVDCNDVEMTDVSFGNTDDFHSRPESRNATTLVDPSSSSQSQNATSASDLLECISKELNGRCFCILNITHGLEKMERPPKSIITSKCGGNLMSVSDLVKCSTDNLHGALNTADLALSRYMGPLSLDWSSKSFEKTISKLMICNDHREELCANFFMKVRGKHGAHCMTTERSGKTYKSCSLPEEFSEPHFKVRPIAQCYITKNEVEKLLEQRGQLLSVGLPICNTHKAVIEKMMKISNDITTPPRPMGTQSNEGSKSSLITPTSSHRDMLSRTKRLTTLQKNVANQTGTEKSKKKKDVFISQKRDTQRGHCITDTMDNSELEEMSRNIHSIVSAEISLIGRRMTNTLTAKIIKVKNESDDEYALRQLGHLKYHSWKKGEDIKLAKPIDVIYKDLFQTFSGEKNDNQSAENNGTATTKAVSFFMAEEKDVEDEDVFQSGIINADNSLDELNNDYDQFVANETTGPTNGSNRVVVMPKEIEEHLEECLIDEYGEELRTADQIVKDMYKSITMIRLCNNNCPTPDLREAATVRSRLIELSDNCIGYNLHNLNQVHEDLICNQNVESSNMSVLEWIKMFSPCYQGLRSVSKRLHELQRLMKIRGTIETINKDTISSTVMRSIFDSLPDQLRYQYINEHGKRPNFDHHTEAAVMKKFGANINNFNAKMTDFEDKVCDICEQLTRRSEISEHVADIVPSNLIADNLLHKKSFEICRMCWREVRDGRTPASATTNKMETDAAPPELQNLNVVENMLIQRVRAIQNVYQLRDIEGNKTGMPAAKGVLVLVPAAVNETVQHVSDVLPNASKMLLLVKTQWEKTYLVSMPKIIAALNWLKANNSLYSDITIDEDFNFELGKNVIYDREDATQEDVKKLIHRQNDNENWLLTQEKFEVQTIREIDPSDGDNGRMAVQTFVMKKDLYRPLSVDEPRIDEKVFPSLHPKGRYGLSQMRAPKVGLPKYCRRRLLQANRIYAKNSQWYSFMLGLKLQKAATSVMGIQARVGKEGTVSDVKLTGRSLKPNLIPHVPLFAITDPKFITNMSRITAKMRGSPEYWATCRLRVKAHVQRFGPPTFFLTLNPNETAWTDLHSLYSSITGENVNGKNIKAHINKDPLIFARYWRHRVAAFFKEIVLAKNGPLGNVTHFFYRVEYQMRGTQHVHCLIWTENRPAADATASEITSFLDKYLTARLPAEADEPNLHKIINSYQKHWNVHSHTCLRAKKYRGVMSSHCRFDFPRDVCRNTMFHTEKGAQKLIGIHKREYMLAREFSDRMVNDYNPAISLAWNGNTDCQYIHVSSGAVCNYVTSYASKKDVEADKKCKPIVGVPKRAGATNKDTFKFIFNILNTRRCGALEIMDELMGHPNFQFDMAHTFVPSDPSEKRTRMLKPAELLKKSDPDTRCYLNNIMDQYYSNRGKSLKNFSLYNIMTNFDIVSKSRTGTNRKKVKTTGDVDDVVVNADDEPIEGLKKGTEYHYDNMKSPLFCHPFMDEGTTVEINKFHNMVFRKRKQTVGRIFLPELEWEKPTVVEEFYRRICIMFIPWTDEQNFIEEQNEMNKWSEVSYLGVYESFIRNLTEIDEEAADDIRKIVNHYVKLQQEDREIAEKLDAMKSALRKMHIEDQDLNEEIEVQKRTVNEKSHETNLESMNTGQKNLFDRIMTSIKDQNDTADEDTKSAFQIFVSGTAGVGKSFVINALADELTLKYTDNINQGLRPAVLIAAPTGLAAIGVKGATIHSMFSIEVQHGTDSPFSELKDKARDLKRNLFSNVQLIILDEISMCSSITLLKMHKRLQQIKACDEMFGGVNIVAFGDLLQLPPVLAPRVFDGVNPYQMRHVFGGVGVDINLWSVFDYCELTENMRQKDDLKFAELMGRIRIQAATTDDIEALKKRIIPTSKNGVFATLEEMAEHFVSIQKEDFGALALFPTNAEVEVFNDKVMELKKMETVEILAIESSVASVNERGKPRKSKRSRIWQRREFKLLAKGHVKNRVSAEDVQASSSSSPNMAGGLPLHLTVAEGARVMLRRNMDVVRGLVNGATGQLLKINKDTNNCVSSLTVKFDMLPNEEIKVERMSVYYDKSFEDRRCRNQFPLVMAFGATVHKAQGLTLKNVMISTRCMFSAGQFFVAASRVQNINGLHLADFHIENVYVDKPSLIEYNRLRSTIGLEIVKLPSSRYAEDETLKKIRNADGQIMVVLDEPKSRMKTSKKNATKKQRAVRSIHNDNEPTVKEMRMILPHCFSSECYEKESRLANAALLTIVRMTDVRRGLQAMDDGTSKLTVGQVLLQAMFDGKVHCLDYLLQELGCEKDSFNSMLTKFIECAPDEIRKLVQYTRIREEKCTECHRVDRSITTEVQLDIGDSSSGNVEEHIERLRKPIILKELCHYKNCNGEKVRKDRFHFSYNHKYAIVVASINKNKYKSLKSDGTKFFDKRWICTASVHDMGTKKQTVWLKTVEGGYIKVVNGKDELTKARSGFLNINVLLFENKVFQRKTNVRDENVDDEEISMEIDDELAGDEHQTTISDNIMINEKSNVPDDDFIVFPKTRKLPIVENDQPENSINIRSTNSNPKILALHNTGSDCFLNANLTLLNSIEKLREDVIRITPTNDILCQLQRIFNRTTNVSTDLRKKLPATLQHGQQDATEALNMLLEVLPSSLTEVFSIRRYITTVCRNSRLCRTQYRQETLSIYNEVAGGTISFDGINRNEETTTKCDSCHKEANRTSRYDTDQRIMIYAFLGRLNAHSYPEIDEIIDVCGKYWKIKACVQYIPMGTTYGAFGHWIAWLREENGFARVDDHHVTTNHDASTIDMSKVSIYCLEALDDEQNVQLNLV